MSACIPPRQRKASSLPVRNDDGEEFNVEIEEFNVVEIVT